MNRTVVGDGGAGAVCKSRVKRASVKREDGGEAVDASDGLRMLGFV
ncbi:MAG: hypothetical protein ACLPTZ_30700 [Beijerinckiaceae bacterium]